MKNIRIALIGPLPPPSGGMAKQLMQLSALLTKENYIDVKIVQVNSPYYPQWIKNVKIIRSLFRLYEYIVKLKRITREVDIFHIFANSGWSWYLFTVPAVWIGRTAKLSVIVNYHGGEAKSFFKKSFKFIRPTLTKATKILVPSLYLKEIFTEYGFTAEIFPNIIDLEKFSNSETVNKNLESPVLLVSRNLEPIYDIATAIKAFVIVLKKYPEARLIIAGSGPEKEKLEQKVKILNVANKVEFTGRLDNEKMPALYQNATVMINPSLVDNMPISILEAFASHVPVVSTNIGGVPYLITNNKTGLLVPVDNPTEMAEKILQLLENPAFAESITKHAYQYVKKYTWPNVKKHLLNIYQGIAPQSKTIVE